MAVFTSAHEEDEQSVSDLEHTLLKSVWSKKVKTKKDTVRGIAYRNCT